MLGIVGEDDTSIPVAEITAFEVALEQAGISKQITIYPDKGHAFVKSMEDIERNPVQKQA